MQGSKNHRSLLKEFFDLSGSNNYKLGEPILSQDVYSCQIEIESDLVIKGTGLSKAEAREDAAKKTFLFLGKEKAENYSPLLQLFLILEGLDRCEFNNITSCQTFIYRVLDRDKILGEGAGLTGTEAKENAAREAYFRLIQIETEKAEYRERLKRGERPNSLISKTTTLVKQKVGEVSHLPQKSVSKQPSAKLTIEGSTRKKTVKKRPEKAAQSQRQTKPDEQRAQSPSHKSQIVVKSPSRETPKSSQKSTTNQISPNQNRKSSPKKKPATKLPKDILKSEGTSVMTHI